MYQIGVRSSGRWHRFLCSCGAGDGVTGKEQDGFVAPERIVWPHTTIVSARVAGRTHRAAAHKGA